MARKSDQSPFQPTTRPSRTEAEEAVRTLLRWAGDDPSREGLRETPARVVRAFDEFFAGYAIDPAQLLARTFEEVDGYDEMVLLRDIRFESYCEHHMVPIIGKAHVAYLPRHRVVGISKLARDRGLRQAAPDPGEDDGADRQHDRRSASARRRRRRHRRRAPVHDHAGRP